MAGNEAGNFSGGACLILSVLEVWLRHHVPEAGLISALGTSWLCYIYPALWQDGGSLWMAVGSLGEETGSFSFG